MSINPFPPTNESLATRCQQERRDYFQNGTPDSPACVELFRRAFAGDQEAWRCVIDSFQPQLIRWARSWDKLLTLFDPEDLAQDAWLKCYRWAPKKPSLVATDAIGPVIKYLKLCLKSAALEHERKYKALIEFVSMEEQHYLTAPEEWLAQVVADSALHPFVAQWVQTEDERFVFMRYFVYNEKPQKIFAADQARFGTYDEVAKILQRLIRRMRRDADAVYQAMYDDVGTDGANAINSPTGLRQKPGNIAFLTVNFSVNSAQTVMNVKDIDVDTPCPYDELILVEYLLGRTANTLTAAIEQSAACMQAATALRQDLSPILQSLTHRQCPTPFTLLEFQERLLTGTEQLLIHRHIESCPLCQAELALSAKMDEAIRSFEGIPSPLAAVRRVVEAIFQSPLTLAQPVRGELGSYQTAHVVIRLTTRLNTGKTRTWSLRGQVRNAEGELIMNEVEEIRLQRLTAEEQLIGEEQELTAPITPGATSFVYKELLAGDYRLRVLTVQEEIIIRQLTIGRDE